jgi:PAS domain S-box-containing protein
MLLQRDAIAAVNTAFETLTGWSAAELVGKAVRVLVDDEARTPFERLLDAAADGHTTTGEQRIVTRAGDALDTELAFTVLSSAKDKQVLVSITHWRELTDPGMEQVADLLYEISLSPFGLLKRSRGIEAKQGSYCFEALHGRASPCTGCPAIKGDRRRALGVIACEGSPSGACIAVAMRVDSSTMRIAALRATKELTSELLAIHADAAATAHALTNREREVFRLALLGRSTAEIAASLRTSASTAKFHLANVCAKLGADSRVDLLRQVLQG